MTSDKPKVLVVDDLEDMRMILRLTLERSGWRIFEAEDGQDAIDMALEIHPDVIVMDFDMPMLDGLQTCQQIKDMPALAQTPIIIYTGTYANHIRAAAYDAGAYDFLTKPILPAELREKVHQAYQQHAIAPR
ncbi:MAG: response regulator [Anaerolineales bacterium]